jgi:hypothetical protein
MGCGHGRSVDGAWTRIGRQDGRIERPCTCFFPNHARAYDSHVRPPQRRRKRSSSSSSISRRSSSRRRKLLTAPIQLCAKLLMAQIDVASRQKKSEDFAAAAALLVLELRSLGPRDGRCGHTCNIRIEKRTVHHAYLPTTKYIYIYIYI